MHERLLKSYFYSTQIPQTDADKFQEEVNRRETFLGAFAQTVSQGSTDIEALLFELERTLPKNGDYTLYDPWYTDLLLSYISRYAVNNQWRNAEEIFRTSSLAVGEGDMFSALHRDRYGDTARHERCASYTIQLSNLRNMTDGRIQASYFYLQAVPDSEKSAFAAEISRRQTLLEQANSTVVQERDLDVNALIVELVRTLPQGDDYRMYDPIYTFSLLRYIDAKGSDEQKAKAKDIFNRSPLASKNAHTDALLLQDFYFARSALRSNTDSKKEAYHNTLSALWKSLGWNEQEFQNTQYARPTAGIPAKDKKKDKKKEKEEKKDTEEFDYQKFLQLHLERGTLSQGVQEVLEAKLNISTLMNEPYKTFFANHVEAVLKEVTDQPGKLKSSKDIKKIIEDRCKALLLQAYLCQNPKFGRELNSKTLKSAQTEEYLDKAVSAFEKGLIDQNAIKSALDFENMGWLRKGARLATALPFYVATADYPGTINTALQEVGNIVLDNKTTSAVTVFTALAFVAPFAIPMAMASFMGIGGFYFIAKGASATAEFLQQTASTPFGKVVLSIFTVLADTPLALLRAFSFAAKSLSYVVPGDHSAFRESIESFDAAIPFGLVTKSLWAYKYNPNDPKETVVNKRTDFFKGKDGKDTAEPATLKEKYNAMLGSKTPDPASPGTPGTGGPAVPGVARPIPSSTSDTRIPGTHGSASSGLGSATFPSMPPSSLNDPTLSSLGVGISTPTPEGSVRSEEGVRNTGNTKAALVRRDAEEEGRRGRSACPQRS